MEGAQAFESLADWAQSDIRTNDIHDVVGLLHLPGQGFPIVRQGAPDAAAKPEKGRGKGGLARPLPSLIASSVEFEEGRRSAMASTRWLGGGSARGRLLGFRSASSNPLLPLDPGKHPGSPLFSVDT